jgi:microcystin-dependent protein
MGTTTTTFALNKPTVGGDDNAWGGDWNSNADKLDDLLDGTTGITPNLIAGWEVGGTAVTATAAELNVLDGVTASTAELNILDGVTASTAELNILDGVTATTAELNYLDITTLGAAEASKALTVAANGTITFSGSTGTSGQVLTSGGSSATPTWANAISAGAVMTFAMNTAPTGWLKANGAAVSRTTYAALFSAIGTTFGVGDGSTTFNLPDLRGRFTRNWADDGSIDSGRAFGSTQDHQIQQHQHGLAFNADVTNATGGTTGATVSACDAIATRNSAGSNQLSTSYVQDAPYVKNATGANIGTETRPTNIALLACIKF